MNRKYGLILMIIGCLLGLSACQLARPEKGESAGDQLIGVYISYDHISQAEEVKINAAGQITIEVDDEKSRLYAIKTEEIKETEDGQKYINYDFHFPEIAGIKMLATVLNDPLNHKARQIFVVKDQAVTEVNMEIKGEREKNEFVHLKGIVYQDADLEGKMLFVNPVFQTADGRVYLRSGKGFAVYGDKLSGNFRQTTTLRNTAVVDDGNEKKEQETVIEMTIVLEKPDEEIVIIQMDKNNEIIDRQNYSVQQMSDKFWPKPEAEYLLAVISKAGGIKTKPIIYTKAEEEFSYLRQGENGILIKESVEIQWELKSIFD
ncbi:hypothetical protein EII17_12400 [Clostridiales bacterium COT073_COT-073]|nr:hypothetical protein EII17_12400 [Clostridiales bacterium COT073_COT-073]